MSSFLLRFPPQAREWLFTPANQHSYNTKADLLRCAKQQPIVANGEPDCLPDYLNPLKGIDIHQEVKPPNLFFGWRVDVQRMKEIVLRDFSDGCVQRYNATRKELDDISDAVLEEDEEEEEEEEEDGKDDNKVEIGGFSVRDTFIGTSGLLWLEIVEKAQIESSLAKRCQFMTFLDEKGVEQLGLSVGTNYLGVLDKATRKRIGDIFKLNESDAHWYLDPYVWYWSKTVPPKDVVGQTYVPILPIPES